MYPDIKESFHFGVIERQPFGELAAAHFRQ
jgi:hypothetical protein